MRAKMLMVALIDRFAASFVLGAVRLERQWFQAAALLVGGAAFYRTVAWALHDAPLSLDKIGIELFTLAIAAFAASRCRGGR